MKTYYLPFFNGILSKDYWSNLWGAIKGEDYRNFAQKDKGN